MDKTKQKPPHLMKAGVELMDGGFMVSEIKKIYKIYLSLSKMSNFVNFWRAKESPLIM
jgi:hypothetical protein